MYIPCLYLHRSIPACPAGEGNIRMFICTFPCRTCTLHVPYCVFHVASMIPLHPCKVNEAESDIVPKVGICQGSSVRRSRLFGRLLLAAQVTMNDCWCKLIFRVFMEQPKSKWGEWNLLEWTGKSVACRGSTGQKLKGAWWPAAGLGSMEIVKIWICTLQSSFSGRCPGK